MPRIIRGSLESCGLDALGASKFSGGRGANLDRQGMDAPPPPAPPPRGEGEIAPPPLGEGLRKGSNLQKTWLRPAALLALRRRRRAERRAASAPVAHSLAD